MKELQIELIAVGDEILIGHTLDTNSNWIASLLSESGLRLRWHSTVSDDASDIRHLIRHAWNRADAVIVTGGLGPTPDDITRPVIAQFFDDELIERQDLKELIAKRFAERGFDPPFAYDIMAQFPSRATPILNQQGSAPGIHYSENGKNLFAMPGVPSEMMEMMNNYVLPALQKETKSVYQFHLFRTAGIWESQLFEIIGESEALSPVGLAYLPSIDHGVTLRLSLAGKDASSVEKALTEKVDLIREKIKDFIFCEDKRTLEEVILQILERRGEKLALAESCTGGLIGAQLVGIPGSSAVFDRGFITYSNESKIEQLGVSPATIQTHGAVSQQTAMEMAAGARRVSGADHAISVTGVAGPTGGSETKPVGLIYIGYDGLKGNFAYPFKFSGNRNANRRRATHAALTLLWNQIKDDVK